MCVFPNAVPVSVKRLYRPPQLSGCVAKRKADLVQLGKRTKEASLSFFLLSSFLQQNRYFCKIFLFLQCFRKQEMPSLENREKRFHSLPGSSFCGSSQAGERDAKATALTQCAFDLNLSSVLLRDTLCNSEAQA